MRTTPPRSRGVGVGEAGRHDQPHRFSGSLGVALDPGEIPHLFVHDALPPAIGHDARNSSTRGSTQRKGASGAGLATCREDAMLNIRGKRLSLTVLIGSAILLVQLGAIAFVHISGSDERYLAWAPNDYAVDYSISTSVHGRALTPEQVADRYGLPAHGLWEYPPQQLIDILSRYEST